MGPLAPPPTVGVAMERNVDHRTCSVEDFLRGRTGDQRNADLDAFEIVSRRQHGLFLKFFDCQDGGRKCVMGRRNRQRNVEKRRQERETKSMMRGGSEGRPCQHWIHVLSGGSVADVGVRMCMP